MYSIVELIDGEVMNNNIFQGLWDIIAEMPVGFQILTITIVLLLQALAVIGGKNVVLYTKSRFRKGKSCEPNTKKDKIQQKDLFNHPLFFSMNYVVNHKIKMMTFGDDKRTKIFRELLEIKITSICKNSRELVEYQELNKLTKVDFKSLVFKCFSNIVDDYNVEFKEKYGKKGYDLIMQHPEKGFNRWHEPVLVYTRDLVEDICDSDMYVNNVERLNSIFNIYHSSIDATLINVEKTFNNFNGELDDLIVRDLI